MPVERNYTQGKGNRKLYGDTTGIRSYVGHLFNDGTFEEHEPRRRKKSAGDRPRLPNPRPVHPVTHEQERES